MTDRLLRYALVMAVAAFFAVMWGLLIRQHVAVPGAATLHPAYEKLLKPGQQERSEQWGVYFSGRRIGESTLKISRQMDGTLTVRSETNLTISPVARYLVGLSGDVDVHFEADISPLRGLRDFRVNSERLGTRMIGIVSDDTLNINGYIGQQRLRTSMPYAANVFMGEVFSPLAALPELRERDVGRFWTVDMVNPLADGVQRVTVSIEASRQMELGGEKTRVYQLIFTTGNARWESWVREDGEILIQGTPFGLTIRREDLAPEVLEELEAPAAPSTPTP